MSEPDERWKRIIPPFGINTSGWTFSGSKAAESAIGSMKLVNLILKYFKGVRERYDQEIYELWRDFYEHSYRE